MNQNSLNDDNGQKTQIFESATTAGKTARQKGNADSGASYVESPSKQAGEDTNNDVMKTEERMQPYNMSATGVVLGTPGRTTGFMINSFTAGATIKFWNNSAGSGAVVMNTFTPTVNGMVDFGCAVECSVGLFATITGTIDITVFAKPDNA